VGDLGRISRAPDATHGRSGSRYAEAPTAQVRGAVRSGSRVSCVAAARMHPPARPTGRCCDRRGRDRPWGAVVAEDLPHHRSDTGSCKAANARGDAIGATWACATSVPDVCAPARTPPAAPRAGFSPLSPTFSPTRTPEEPLYLAYVYPIQSIASIGSG
jgi:hypothetical protein